MVNVMKIEDISPPQTITWNGQSYQVMLVWLYFENEMDEYPDKGKTVAVLKDSEIDAFFLEEWKIGDYVLVDIQLGYKEWNGIWVPSVKVKIGPP